jgi:hypothetical protein
VPWLNMGRLPCCLLNANLSVTLDELATSMAMLPNLIHDTNSALIPGLLGNYGDSTVRSYFSLGTVTERPDASESEYFAASNSAGGVAFLPALTYSPLF